MSQTQAYLTLCCREQWMGGQFWRTHCQGDALCLDPDAFRGTVCLPPVDSSESGFVWSRLRLISQIPSEATIKVYARASDDRMWSSWESMTDRPETPLDELFGPPVGAGDDLLLPCTGRYLWLALEMTAGGAAHPRVEGLSLRMSGDHMVDYLPAIYQGQDFTYRYLSIFNSMLQDMEAVVEDMPRQLDPSSASEDMLRYLAQWLCSEPDAPAEELRRRLPALLDEYETMYTATGIRRSVERLTGCEPLLIEHFSVDPNDPDCRNPQLYRRLYGDEPYRLFLLLPNDTFTSQRELEGFLQKMRELIPAETGLELILLKPCVQLDWHTYLGINSRIGSYIPAAINESMTIHYDTTIGGADHER